MNGHITRYDRMPIPPVEAQTTWFDAGAVRIGVEYRLLNEAIAAAAEVVAARGASAEEAAAGDQQGREAASALQVSRSEPQSSEGHRMGEAERSVGPREGVGLDDRGVSLHVFSAGASPEEFLRFDCFDEDPHYHYISWRAMSNEMLHLDPIADGDPLAWALERIRTRLPQMLARAGAADLAARVDAAEIERALPRIAEAAYRARYHSDAGAVLRSALGSAA